MKRYSVLIGQFLGIAILVILTLGIQGGCDTSSQPTGPDDSNDRSDFPVRVAYLETSWGEVSIYAQDTLRAGYSELLVKVKRNGEYVQLNDFHFTPQMAMGMGMTHGTPIDTIFWDEQLLGYRVALVWVMASYGPSGDTLGAWSVGIRGTVGMDTINVTVPVTVYYADWVRAFLSATDRSKIIAVLHLPHPTVGFNAFDLFVYRKEERGGFVPVTDLQIEIEPEMPSMGHGSPNNQDPVHWRKGRYRGKVNFTMTGEWVIHTHFYRNGEEWGSIDFTVIL